MVPHGTEGPDGVAELASTMRGLKEAFEQLSEKVDKMSQDVPAKWARKAEPLHAPSRQGQPVWVVPKKTPGKYSLIQHLSYPKGSSVDDMIPQSSAQSDTPPSIMRLD
ncbi:UNVERIFIED_CONTAM: hypothetical protein K2H54_053578 [Gekko kuhli]